MSLITTLQYVSRVRYLGARYLGAIAFLGFVLMLNGSNRVLTQTGMAIAFTASGAAIVSGAQKQKFQDAEQIQQANHQAELQALQSHLQTTYGKREASLKTFLEMAMAESETLKSRIAQMHEVLADDQLEKVSIFGDLEALQIEHQYLLHDLQAMAIAEATITAQFAHFHTNAQDEINQLTTAAQTRITAAQTRIAELEATLAQKTEMAAQMLTELESEATGTFNQFNAKVISQGERIQALHQQIESLKQTNAALTRQQIDRQISNIGSTDLMSHSLLNR
ncbi:MAG: hypothetical protein AB8B99_08585 [Phormidesmis sp.]